MLSADGHEDQWIVDALRTERRAVATAFLTCSPAGLTMQFDGELSGDSVRLSYRHQSGQASMPPPAGRFFQFSEQDAPAVTVTTDADVRARARADAQVVRGGEAGRRADRQERDHREEHEDDHDGRVSTTATRVFVRRLRPVVVGGAATRLRQGVALEWLTHQRFEPGHGFLVAHAAPLRFATDRRRWGHTLAALGRHGGRIAFDIRRRSLTYEERSWRRVALQYLQDSLVLPPIDTDHSRDRDELSLHRELLTDGDEGFALTLRVEGRAIDALVAALDTDLDGRLFEETSEVAADLANSCRLWSRAEILELLEPPFTLDDALTGASPHHTPSPFKEATTFSTGASAPATASSAPAIVLGTAISPLARGLVGVTLPELVQHVLTVGGAGWGKTTSTMRMAAQVMDAGVSVMVIDPVKRDYERLAEAGRDVHVIDCSPERPLAFNPFYPPPAVSVGDHAGLLAKVFALWFPTNPIAGDLLHFMIRGLYARRIARAPRLAAAAVGRAATPWNVTGRHLRQCLELVPTFDEFIAEAPRALDRLESAQGPSQWMKDARDHFHRRLAVMNEGRARQLFAPAATRTTLQTTFRRNIVLQLHRILDPEEKHAIAAVLLAFLTEWRLSEGVFTNALRHLLILEEAHGVLPADVERYHLDFGPSPGEVLGRILSNQLAELRATGQGIVLVEQSPLKLQRDAMINTSTRIIHRLGDGDDQRRIGESLGLTLAQQRTLARLPVGEAVVMTPREPEPRIVRMRA